jgi:FKBP-type peptidyl-prolyl cis-trans isomerase
MSILLRTTQTALVAMTLAISLAACDKPADSADAAKTDETAAAEDGALDIVGLEGEKAQAGYMIGMEMAKSLEPVKDEIDQEALFKAIRGVLAGEEPLMTDEQAKQVAEALGQKMQAKMAAEMEAKGTENAEAGRAFLAENSKKEGVKTTDSGLQYQVISEGKGAKPTADEVVKVHYKGTLLDGTTFDDSIERGEPVVFPLSQVVPGWREGIALMPVGSKFKFWIPSELGYGEMGTPGGPIGPNATLVFEVELLEIVKQPPAG